MKKVACGFVIITLILSLLIFHENAYASKVNDLSSIKTTPLYVVLLMDASGSMKKTDPEGFRILASQTIISLLSPEDKVAIIEFGTTAKIISNWENAANTSIIFNLLNQIGSNDHFTDFRAGIATATQLFEKAPAGSNKVIFLLTDGDLDPNPYSDIYAPYNIQYRLAIRGKDKNEIRKINETYKGYLSPIAKRIIETNLIPVLKKNEIEVYCVGFSAGSDRVFLNHLADETTKSKTESHYFYANNAIDLMETFVTILHFWKNKIVLKSERGNITAGLSNRIAMDAYLKDVSFIALTEKPSDFFVQAANKEEKLFQGTHPNLKIVPIIEKKPPGVYNYGFRSGTGQYRLLAVGRSTLDLLISGLKEKYHYGEPLRATAAVDINGQNALAYLGDNPRVIAEIITEDSKEGPLDLQLEKSIFLFEYFTKRHGKARIKFTLLAKDKDNNDLLPRPSKEFITEILPRFYVEPENITFGDLSQGKQKERLVKIHSGLDQTVKISANSNIRNASRCGDVKEKLPFLKVDAFEIQAGQSLEKSLSLTVPKDGCWGDFEGDILFISDKGEQYTIAYRVHVPSIWEKLTWFALVMMFVLATILILLAVFWGYLKSPVGVLRPVNVPSGAFLLNDIKLSTLKRGFWHRFLHWKKNVITIGATGADLKIVGLPQTMKVELIFHRFGGDYIKNASPKESAHHLTVCNPDIKIEIERRPGASYQLGHGLHIKIGDYEFIYEHIK